MRKHFLICALRFFPLSKIEKKNLVGDIGPDVHLGMQFTSFLGVYPKMSMKIVSKTGLKD